MKKITIISILLNVVLFISTVILLYNSNVIKKEDLSICKNKTKSSIYTPITVNTPDLIYVFNSRKFPCNSKYTSLEINLCSQKKLQFADSLLNELVKSELNKLDNYIKRDKEIVLKGRENSFFVNCLRINTVQKEEFLKSQKYWEETRKLNAKIKEIGCDTGTGCAGFVNSAEIDDVLTRIKKIQELGLGCN